MDLTIPTDLKNSISKTTVIGLLAVFATVENTTLFREGWLEEARNMHITCHQPKTNGVGVVFSVTPTFFVHNQDLAMLSTHFAFLT